MRNEPKMNLIMAIELGNPALQPYVDGSITRPQRWIQILQMNYNQFVLPISSIVHSPILKGTQSAVDLTIQFVIIYGAIRQLM